MTNAVDGEGLKKSVAAALSAGVSRFLLVSAFPESARGETTSESFENYMRVKKMADVELAQSELDWVILRPGALQDKTGTGYVRAGLAIRMVTCPVMTWRLRWLNSLSNLPSAASSLS
jgi:uncharacterized protein YbjT (DUF2867 family)